MDKRKRQCIYMVAALNLPIVISTIVFAIMGFFPFGDKSILVWDMNWQYVSFLSWLIRTAKKTTMDSLFYSFSISYGSSTLGLLGYYLLSPFNILLLFFDTKTLPIGILIVTLLKLGSCGLTMYIFLHTTIDESGEKAKELLLFSTSFALMGYNISQMSNIMWLDAVVLLPVIALGIHIFVYKKRSVIFILSLSWAISINFYTGYMLCIFSGMYLVAEILLKNEKWRINEVIRDLLKGGACIFLSVAMAAWSLFPVYYEISESRMNESSIWDTLKMIKSMDDRMWELPNKLFLGTYNVHQLKNGLPNIYVGCLSIILAFLFLADRRNKESSIYRKEKLVYGGLCSIFLISMISLGINMIWHGFAKTEGSPYRYTFLLSFSLIVIACKQLMYTEIDFSKIKYKRLVFIGITGIGILLLYYKANKQYFIDGSDYLSLKQVALTVSIIFCWILLLEIRRYNKQIVWGMLILLSVELGINMGLNINHFDYSGYNEYRSYVEKMEITVDQIYGKDKDVFCRVENDIRYETENCYNDAMLIGYPSVTHYSSVLPYKLSEFAKEEGMVSNWQLSVEFQKNSVDIQDAGRSSIKYLITEELPEEPEGWEIQETEPYYVLKNQYYQQFMQFEKQGDIEVQPIERAKINVKLDNKETDNQELKIMIPWHLGWHAEIDGQKVEINKYKSAAMEISVPPGEHILTMRFTPVYLKEGIIISIISWIVFAIMVCNSFGVGRYRR